jgi:hypothetical protein
MFTGANQVTLGAVPGGRGRQYVDIGNEGSAAMRPKRPIPDGLRPKRARAALQSLAGVNDPSAFCALRAPFLTRNASGKHRVNRP